MARASNGGKVTVTVRSDQTATAARGQNDPNSHSIAYVGPSSIATFAFNPNGLASEGGAVTSGRNGVDANNDYFSFVTPGMYFTNATATGAFAFTNGVSTRHSGSRRELRTEQSSARSGGRHRSGPDADVDVRGWHLHWWRYLPVYDWTRLNPRAEHDDRGRLVRCKLQRR